MRERHERAEKKMKDLLLIMRIYCKKSWTLLSSFADRIIEKLTSFAGTYNLLCSNDDIINFFNNKYVYLHNSLCNNRNDLWLNRVVAWDMWRHILISNIIIVIRSTRIALQYPSAHKSKSTPNDRFDARTCVLVLLSYNNKSFVYFLNCRNLININFLEHNFPFIKFLLFRLLFRRMLAYHHYCYY
jgi:hypothetical protein